MARKVNPKIAKAKLINMLKLGAGYMSGDYSYITDKQTFLKNNKKSKPVTSKYFGPDQRFETKKLGFKYLKFEEFKADGYGVQEALIGTPDEKVDSISSLGVKGATDFIAKVINDSIVKNGVEFTLNELNSEIQSDRGGIFRIMMAEYQEALNQPDLNVTEIMMVCYKYIKSLNLAASDYEGEGFLNPSITSVRQDGGIAPDFSAYAGEAEKLIDFLTHLKL